MDTGVTPARATEEMIFQRAIDRFLPKIAIAGDDECWIFQGARGGGGYGSFWDGTNYPNGRPRVKGAHRFSYRMFVGPVQDDMDVLHTCDNPPCVNPNHLWVGTHSENMRDAVAKGKFRDRKPSTAILTEEQVAQIRRDHRGRGDGLRLARRYGVNPSTISKIVTGINWAR